MCDIDILKAEGYRKEENLTRNKNEKELYEAITTEKLSIVKWIYRNRYSQNYIFNGLIISHMLFGSNLQICKFIYKNVNFRCKNDKKSMNINKLY